MMIRPRRGVLAADQSQALRDQRIAQLNNLKSTDEAADWVHKNLPAKNTLTFADAKLIEDVFQKRLAAIGEERPDSAPCPAADSPLEEPSPMQGQAFDGPEMPGLPMAVVRPPIAAKTIRLRDKEHCKFVASQPCIVCGRKPAEAHHVRFAQPRALNRKVSDEYTVPVCRVHHRELHQYGDEVSWWAGVNIDPLPIALELWRRSRSAELAKTRSLAQDDKKEIRISTRLQPVSNCRSGRNVRQSAGFDQLNSVSK
jgi:hypothetical protein